MHLSSRIRAEGKAGKGAESINPVARQAATKPKADPSLRWLALCWLILLAYRVLRPLLGKERTIAALRNVLSRGFSRRVRAYMDKRFGISQAQPANAFEDISRNYKTRGEKFFGPRFTYVQAVQDQKRSHTHITRCLFNDFFRKHSVPELTSIFCALDMVWADELSHPHYQTRFERPTTLAAGDDACRFQFSRKDAGKQLPLGSKES